MRLASVDVVIAIVWLVTVLAVVASMLRDTQSMRLHTRRAFAEMRASTGATFDDARAEFRRSFAEMRGKG